MAKKRGAESKSAWFRKFFRDNPEFVREGTNDEVLKLWEADHPGRVLDDSIRNVMSNVKSTVKKELNAGKTPKQAGRKPAERVETPVPKAKGHPSRRQLEELEFAMDHCLSMAKQMNDPALEKAMQHLRFARNLVVWQQGEPG